MLRIRTDVAEADLYLHGRSSPMAAGNSRPVIFLSEHSLFEKESNPRRCARSVFHGSVRARARRRMGSSAIANGFWNRSKVCRARGACGFQTASDAGTLAIWPYAYEARLIIQLERSCKDARGAKCFRGIVHVF